MVVMMPAAQSFGEIRHIGKLAARRSRAKVRRKSVQLVRGCRIPACRGALRGALQVCGNLLRHLRILARIRLLKLLQRVHQLSERGKLAIVRAVTQLTGGRSGA